MSIEHTAGWDKEQVWTFWRREKYIRHARIGNTIINLKYMGCGVFYGCETWSLTLTDKRRLRVFENMVLRRIFGPKRDEVTRESRKVHKDEINDLYSSPNTVRAIKSRRMRWAGHVARLGAVGM